MRTLHTIRTRHSLTGLLPALFLFILVIVVGRSSVQAQPTGSARIPDSGKTMESFIPAGWHFLDSTSGDLNKDKLVDLVLALEADDPNEEDDANSAENSAEENDGETADEADGDWEGPPRVLVVLFKRKSGGYRLSARADSFLLRKNEGGVLGDPWAGIGVDRGSLTVHFYGGSAWRWGLDYRFRFQDGGWYLIGATTVNYHSSSGEMESYDFNLLTGDVEITKGNMFGQECRPCDNCDACEPCEQCGECEHCVSVEDEITRKNIGKKNLRKLESFVPMSWEILPENFI